MNKYFIVTCRLNPPCKRTLRLTFKHISWVKFAICILKEKWVNKNIVNVDLVLGCPTDDLVAVATPWPFIRLLYLGHGFLANPDMPASNGS